MNNYKVEDNKIILTVPVKKITKDSITLGISDYKFKYEKTLRLSPLEKLVELPSKPLSYVVKIIKIDKSKKLDRK